MLKAVKLPARISDLNTSLTDVDRDALSHFRSTKQRKQIKDEDEEGRKGKARRLLRRLRSPMARRARIVRGLANL